MQVLTLSDNGHSDDHPIDNDNTDGNETGWDGLANGNDERRHYWQLMSLWQKTVGVSRGAGRKNSQPVKMKRIKFF